MAQTPPPVTGSAQLVVVANRLPVDQLQAPDGSLTWQRSPGGLVTAVEPVMQRADGAWIGWSGAAGAAPDPLDVNGLRLVPVPLSAPEVADYYEGASNSTFWPLYRDVIAPPEFHRRWWRAYTTVNQRFADADAAVAEAAPAGTVWVHDYQLQLVPAMLRAQRPDLRIGFFDHIPFPGYEIFAQLPWRRQVVHGLLGADLVGFQRQGDVSNFLRACRRAAGLTTRGATIRLEDRTATPTAAGLGRPQGGEGARREVRAGAYPISIDTPAFDELARRDDVRERAARIRASLGNPPAVFLGVDRLDYTKGILHRLKAYGELLTAGRIAPPDTVLVQVASPSREHVEQYQTLRGEVEAVVGRINGDHSQLGVPAVHYLHQSYPREEMAALYLAADVMLVTSLRDGMNLVAKEYVACRHDERGALVLSEFTGAADELKNAYLVNPHDIESLKDTILRATEAPPREAARRMRSLRRSVGDNDVTAWATAYLTDLNDTHRSVPATRSEASSA